MANGLLFYLGCFVLAFLFCFPFGPASLEMALLALQRRHRPAWAMALGAALTDAALATAMLAGMKAVVGQRGGSPLWNTAALLVSGLLLLFGGRSLLGIAVSSRECVASAPPPARGARWAFGKGISYSLITPTTPLSWMVVLSLLRSSGIYAPPGPLFASLFFFVVAAGYFAYFALLIRGALHLEKLLSPRAKRLIDRLLGLLLTGLGLWLAGHALQALRRG